MTIRNAVILLAAGVLLAGCDSAPAPTVSLLEVTNPAYGYAFQYPDTLDFHAYSSDDVAIGRKTEDGFTAVLEAGVFKAEDDSPAAYEDFVADRARTLCAADGPGTSLRCTDVQQRIPFETETGLTGSAFYLKHETVDVASGTVSAQSGRGPFFVFNLSANVPSARHAVLIIRPPIVLEPDAVDSELIRRVASSLRIEKVETP